MSAGPASGPAGAAIGIPITRVRAARPTGPVGGLVGGTWRQGVVNPVEIALWAGDTSLSAKCANLWVAHVA